MLKVPSVYRGLQLVYYYDDGREYDVSQELAIELELTATLDDEAIDNLCSQFLVPADYDGVGSKGTKFVFYQ